MRKMTENTGKYMEMQEVDATYSGKCPGSEKKWVEMEVGEVEVEEVEDESALGRVRNGYEY